MSDEFSRHDNDDVPRFEPWVGMLFASLVPVAIGVAVPSLFVPLSIVTGVLFVASMVMLKAQAGRQGNTEAT